MVAKIKKKISNKDKNIYIKKCPSSEAVHSDVYIEQ